MDKTKHDLKSLEEVLESMPIFGDLRELNPHLFFGQYLTGLKEWFDRLREEKRNFEREICEMRQRNKLGIENARATLKQEHYNSMTTEQRNAQAYAVFCSLEGIYQKILGRKET